MKKSNGRNGLGRTMQALTARVAAYAMGLLAAGAAGAADYTWSGRGTDGNWSRPTNWNSTAYPSVTGDTATFDTNPGGKQPNHDVAVTIDALTATGSVAWTWSGAQTVTVNRAFVYADSGASTFNPPLSGNGTVVVAMAGGSLTLGYGTNSYAGKTIVNAGTLTVANSGLRGLAATNNVFGAPAAGNEEIIIGDTNGASDATLKLGVTVAAITFTNVRPLRARSGSSGKAILDVGLQGYNLRQTGPIVLDKDLYIKTYNYNTELNFAGSISGDGGLRFFKADLVTPNYWAYYRLPDSPAFNGGTTISSNVVFAWQSPLSPGDDRLAHFGNGPITLDYGTFRSWWLGAGGVARLTIDNPIIVTPNNGRLQFYLTGVSNGTNLFTGGISLGGLLTIGDDYADSGYVGRYQGPVTLDQSAGGRCGFLAQHYAYTVCALDGNIADGAGDAANSLILRSFPSANGNYIGPQVLTVTGAGSTYANGTIVDGDKGGLIDVRSTGSALGVGNLWVLEGGRIRLSDAANLNAAATATLYANQCALSVLAVSNNFCPTFTADSAGVLALDTTGCSAVSSLASLGSGVFLGSIVGGSFTGASLLPCADGIYRLGGGGGTLTIANSVLAGSGNSVQVGHPCGGNSTLAGVTFGSGSGTIKLLAANTYGGGSVVNANSLLVGQAQVSGTSFGSTNGITLVGGALQLDGTNVTVSTPVGALSLTGSVTVTMNQSTSFAQTNTLAIASLPPRSGAAPWTAVMNGSAATRIGGKERIVVTNGAPAVNNNMVAPYMVTANAGGASPWTDYLTYSTQADAAGMIGFTNAAGYYTACATVGALNGCSDASIANVTASYAMNQDVGVHALRVGAFTLSGVPNTIRIGSGGLIFHGAGTVSANVSFSNAEGVVCANYADATLSGSLTGTNGLTKFGLKKLTLSGTSPALTGTIAVLQGILSAGSDAALGAAANPIYLNGGTLSLPTIGAYTNNRALYLGPSGGALDNGAADTRLVWGGPITGPGMLTIPQITGGTLLLTNANNTYAGGTAILYRNHSVASNSTFGVGDVYVAWGGYQNPTALGLYGDRNIGGGDCYGNNTVSRQARFTLLGIATVYFYSPTPSVGSLSGSGTIYLTNNVLTVGGDNTSTIFDGQIVPMAGATGGTLKKIGAGTFRFQGVNACTNATIVDGGKFVLDGRLAGGVTVTANGALAGSGQINGTVSNSGTLAPALTTNRAAVLTVNAADGLTLAANSVLRLNIQSASQYDRIRVNGPVVIDGATLQVNLLYEPAPTDVFYLVLNGSAGGTTGAFAGIPADEAVALGNDYSGKISYAGTGDATANNDVKLYEVGKGKRGTFIFFR